LGTGPIESAAGNQPAAFAGYDDFLRDIKAHVQAARVKAALTVNRELVQLYWSIGHDIAIRQKEQGWGAKVTDRLTADLRREFPDMKGFSPTNLKYMRRFAEECPDGQFGQQAAEQCRLA
jgi:predicted nuclease of restriction endonuclease-like (RecB) superfamily